MSVLLKLALVPLVVWLASLAGRRWGHAVTGWISGLPLIAGPISVFLALDQGNRFAAETAASTLQVTGAVALHCFVFAHAARRFGWAASLLAAWAAFVAGAALLGAAPLPPLAGAALTVAFLALALVALPKTSRTIGPVAIPGTELAVRVAGALALAAAVTLGASMFGPRLSGILLAFPITGSVLPAFTLALHGSRGDHAPTRGLHLRALRVRRLSCRRRRGAARIRSAPHLLRRRQPPRSRRPAS